MALPTSSRLQLAGDINISRILTGMWQVSGSGHGNIDPVAAIKSMFHYLDAGFTTWDLADIYGPAEDLMGEFRRQLLASRGKTALSSLQIFTKWVPEPRKINKQIVQDSINKSLTRMGVESIDLLQFHWWDYRNNNYLNALQYLSELQKEGKIKHLGLTNFDTEHLKIIQQAGINIVSNQVQFSIIDRRPEIHMIQFCQQHNIKLLTYGTLCGGLLSESYLDIPEPLDRDLNTVSLKKYKNMIDKWGGWQLFQELLIILKQIANKHNVSIANVAIRYILDKPTVGGVIIGARLGLSDHLQDNLKVFQFTLDNDDREKIDNMSKKARNLYSVIGDCGDEYR